MSAPIDGPIMDHDRRNPYGVTGTKLANTTDAAEALRLGGLDWNVTLAPVQSTVMDDTGVTTVDFPDKQATIRHNADGTKAPLGIVGNTYHPIQNAWTVDLLQQLADSSNAPFTAVGATHNGNRTFVQMLMPQGVLIGGLDALDLSLTVFNSHDGSTKLVGVPTLTRIFCTNQFPSLRRSETQFSIRHTEGASRRWNL